MPAIKEARRYTYADYKTWPDDERWELIDGEAYDMSPAPNRWHQKYLSNFNDVFRAFLKGKPCEVYFAPFDVIMPAEGQSEDESDTVVQPDLVVFCEKEKLTFAGATGAPDFALEILSPSTAFKDMDQKRRLYERQGVREYWVANPANKTLLVYRQQALGTFAKPLLFSVPESVEVSIFPGLWVNLGEVFGED